MEEKIPPGRFQRALAPLARMTAGGNKRRWLPHAVIALLAVYHGVTRSPIFLMEPRIWAEEGSVYIQAFLDGGFAGSLFAPHLGYYSLVPNLTTAASVSAFGLKWAAYGTTYVSLAVTLLCVLAPLYLPSDYWRRSISKFLLTLAGIFMSSVEIWLNTIGAQFYLGLFSCYLLLTDFSRLGAAAYRFSMGMLAAAVLTGVTSAVLFPFFLYRAYLAPEAAELGRAARRRLRTVCAVVGAGLAVQLAAFAFGGADGVSRLALENLGNLPEGFFRTVFYSVHGHETLISAMFGLLVVAVVGWAVVKARETRLVALLIVWLGLAFALLSIDMAGGGRYSLAPAVLTLICILNVRPPRPLEVAIAAFPVFCLFALYKGVFLIDTRGVYDPEWGSFAEEYETSRRRGLDHIEVYPKGAGAPWRITLPRQTPQSDQQALRAAASPPPPRIPSRPAAR